MIKLCFCLHRSPALTRAQFQSYWHDTHGPLVRSHAETLGIRAYVQTHTIDDPVNDLLVTGRNSPEVYDGIAEIWFDSLENLHSRFADESTYPVTAEIFEDEKKFIDHERSPIFIAEEKTVIETNF